jgi:hypothetical protein
MADIINLEDFDVDQDVFSVSNALQGVLDRVVSVYASYGVPLPDRQYWTMGTPSIDCAQVVVSFIQMYLGPPGDEATKPQRCNQPRTVVMNVTVSRAIPVVGQSGRAPSSERIQAGSVISAVDSWILMQSINELDQWEDGAYGLGVIATLNAPDPQGGFQSVNLQITMAVP